MAVLCELVAVTLDEMAFFSRFTLMKDPNIVHNNIYFTLASLTVSTFRKLMVLFHSIPAGSTSQTMYVTFIDIKGWQVDTFSNLQELNTIASDQLANDVSFIVLW